MSKEQSGAAHSTTEHAQWGSRFGYIMVAAGAAIGLGNIWRFPYLAYEGGGMFILVYIILVIIMGHPVIEMETAIGRYARANVAASYGKIKKKYSFIGGIGILCTTLIDMYYVVVGGWMIKYAVDYLTGVDFGENTQIYFDNFTSSTWSPIIFTIILLTVNALLLGFGITNLVEKATKYIMPALAILLVICGIWAVFSSEGAIEGLKYYLYPDISKLDIGLICSAATQVLFSIGIGWGIYVTLGASLPKENSIKTDSMWVSICDTGVALIAGFVVIPSAFGAGLEMTSGRSLIFVVMTQVFAKLPGGRIIGIFFFLAIVLSVLSTLFTIIEIPTKWIKETLKITQMKAVILTSAVIFAGSIFVSLGFGMLSDIKIPWLDFNGISYFNIYDWLDTFTAYVLLPLGCMLTSFYIVKVWGFKEYEKELTMDGRDGKISSIYKFMCAVIVPVMMLVIILYCFGLIK